MTKTRSTMLPLGTLAPDFSLPDVVHNQQVTFRPTKPCVATLVFFICNHCPFVKHINAELVRLAHDYLSKDIRFIAISANDIEAYPQDSPENMKKTAEQEQYPFPYLFDETQEVARAYHAACTPDFFLFDASHRLVYRGQLDDSRPGNELPVDGQSIRTALDQLLANQPISIDQKPSLGCNIKWKED